MAESSSIDSWRMESKESERRFYNTINEIRFQMGWPPIKHPSGKFGNQIEDRTILIKIHQEKFVVSWEELEQIFSRCGMIEYTEILCPGGEFHSKIRFQTTESAIKAFDDMNHRYIYEGCCQMELFLETQISAISSEIETSIETEQWKAIPVKIENELPGCREEIEAASKGFDATPQLGSSEAFAKDHRQESFLSGSNLIQEDSGKIEAASFGEIGNEIPSFQEEIDLNDDSVEDFDEESEVQDRAINENMEQPQFESSKVISCLSGVVAVEVASKELMGCSIEVSSKQIETRRTGSGMNSVRFLESSNALKVFVEMPDRNVLSIIGLAEKKIFKNSDLEWIASTDWLCSYLVTFDPGGVKSRDYKIDNKKICFPKLLRGSLLFQLRIVGHTKAKLAGMGMRTRVFVIVNLGIITLVYDPGGLVVESHNRMGVEGSEYIEHHICNKSSKPDNPWIGWCTTELENVGCMGFYGFCGCAQDGCNELINVWNDIEVVANSLDIARVYAFHGKMVELVSMPFDRGRVGRSGLGDTLRLTKQGLPTSYVYDPGGGCASTGMCNEVANDVKLVFDPGIPK